MHVMSNQGRCYRQLQIRAFFHFLDYFSYARKMPNYFFLSVRLFFRTFQIDFHYINSLEALYSELLLKSVLKIRIWLKSEQTFKVFCVKIQIFYIYGRYEIVTKALLMATCSGRV